MDAKPTEEPWTQEGLTIKALGRGVIAHCPPPLNGGVFGCSANARLISKAYLIPEMEKALAATLDQYVRLAGSGDCGFWNPEEEEHVKDARSILAKLRETTP